ncbi:MAG: DNA polymerase III subunit [Firmicutes bacterium]|nr:DNA polymerase III subunit [Bacillota bacterium]
MSFSEITGNEKLKERLGQIITGKRIFHGYIFEGPAADADALADQFVKAALCESQSGDSCDSCVSCRKVDAGNSEDIITYGVEGSIKDKEVQALISRTLKKSYTGNRVFMIIRNADQMTARAQNRLLKTLEEPPTGVTIIMITENAENLLQTIRSRAQLIKLYSDGVEKPESDEEFRKRAIATAAAVIEGKPVFSIWKDIEFFVSAKPSAQAFIGIAETFYRDVLISAYDRDGRLIINRDSIDVIERCRKKLSPDILAGAIESSETAAADLARNVSAGHAVKYMIFDIQEKLAR